MTYLPLQVANEFIKLQTGGIHHIKLQKLTYLCQGWWLAMTGEALLSERPEVWRYGPVFSSMYNVFVGRGDKPIVNLGGGWLGQDIPLMNEGSKEIHHVRWIWDEYGALSEIILSEITHAIGTPWRIRAEANNFKVPLHTEIPENEDWAYFAELAKERGLTSKSLGLNSSRRCLIR